MEAFFPPGNLTGKSHSRARQILCWACVFCGYVLLRVLFFVSRGRGERSAIEVGRVTWFAYSG